MNIVVADDLSVAIDIGCTACNTLGVTSRWVLGQKPITSEADFLGWVDNAAGTAGDLLVILDLGFRRAGTTVWDVVDQAIGADGKSLLIESNIPEARWDGMALALALGNRRKNSRLFYYIASGQATPGLTKEALEGLLKRRGLANCAVHIGCGYPLSECRSRPRLAECLVADACEQSKGAFPPLFPEESRDALVESLLTEIQSITQPKDCDYTKCTDWHHDRLSSTTSLGCRYLVGKFNLTDGETRSAKVLMQCGGSGLADIFTKSSVWASPVHALTQQNCRRILSKLEMNAISFRGSNNVWLPIMPGLPFLLGFRRFVTQLARDGASPVQLFWHCEPHVCRIEVSLSESRLLDGKQESLPPFGLRDKYHAKTSKGEFTGVSGALHDVVHGRLSNLRGGGAIALLFQGHGRTAPVVHLDWDPWKVKLSWQIS